MTDRLAEMLAMQRELQRGYYDGRDVATLSGRELMDYLIVQAYACGQEIGEALNETGWKPWTTSNHFFEESFKAEMVDAWHFFMNLMVAGGMSADDLYNGYKAKHQINEQRQAGNYDGLSGKCPLCKRALDDPATRCRPANYYQGPYAYCVDIGNLAKPTPFPKEDHCHACLRVFEPGVKCVNPAGQGFGWCESYRASHSEYYGLVHHTHGRITHAA